MIEKHTPQRRPVTDWLGNPRKTWCGPYAVATVCGMQYEPSYRLLKKMSKFCKEYLEPNSLYIIEISKHVFVIDTRDWTVIDNQLPEWAAMENYHLWNKQVKGYIKINNPAIGSFHNNLEFDFYETRRVI